MQVVRTIAAVRDAVGAWRAAGQRVALVPTMGALHDGHLSLVARAREIADRTVASIFVNPTQFAPHEDFASYPRTEERDLEMLQAAGTDLVFAPPREEVYRPDHRTKVEVAGLGQILEGEFRPHFFAGVATVVSKLFIQVTPHAAIFGEKDYQQLCVIRAMTRDLDLPVEIIGAPTVREADGLAMSSRNAYLSAEERTVAPALHAAIADLASKARGAPLAGLCDAATARVLAAGFKSVDYIAVRDAETLAEPTPGRPLRVLAAAWLGKTRLIDNVAA